MLIILVIPGETTTQTDTLYGISEDPFHILLLCRKVRAASQHTELSENFLYRVPFSKGAQGSYVSSKRGSGSAHR